MITNVTEKTVRRVLPKKLSKVYYPRGCDWSYSHHASLGYYKGRIYAMWSNGMVNEDHPGQRVLYSTSEDGIQWTTPEVLIKPEPEEAVLTAAGFYDNGEKLIAYAGYYEYMDAHVFELGQGNKNVTLVCRESSDGENWSDTRDLKIPIVPNHGPQKTSSGRLIISGNMMFPYSDEADGLSGWKLTGISPFPWEPLFDDCQGIAVRAKYFNERAVCEGSFFETDDKVLHMLLRTEGKTLALSESYDNGTTWTEIKQTDFTDCGGKFHCGRLPDGRFYVVGNPDPAGARCPLVISTSEDGITFDREYVVDGRWSKPRIRGYGKGGIFGYPHSIMIGNTMYIICSENKEDVNVYRVEVSDLA